MSDEKKKGGPIAWMARNHVASNLLMIILLVGGAAMFAVIRQEVFPEIATDTVSVRVPYPGASPEEVEQGIILAVEESLRGLTGIKEVTSVASEGMGMITAELLESADDMKVYQDIKSEIDRISTFPEDAEEPVVQLDVRRREVMSIVLFGEARETSLRQLGERVQNRLLIDPIITQVDLEGVKPLEISIEVPPENLRRYGLTIQDVANRLKAASVELPGGGVKTEYGEILVRMKERRDWGREFADTPILSNADGTEVLLSDIGTITDGLADADRYANYDGKPAVMLEIYRVGNQTPIEVAKAVNAQLALLQNDLPIGIQARILRDRSNIFRQRAQLLMKNGTVGLVLVLCLLGIFLQLRLAFWVMMGVPVSFLGALMLMPAFGLSINMITMFAFILALGIVVDDAIVVGENVYHYHQAGMSFEDAAVEGARQVSLPVGFSILTNVVAFLPLCFLPGRMGKIMWMMPIVVCSAFIISWLECLFVLPAHLGHPSMVTKVFQVVFAPIAPIFSGIHRIQQSFSHWFIHQVRTKYGPTLEFGLRHRYLVAVSALSIFLITFGYIRGGHMGFQTFPKVESDYAYGYVTMPYGTPIERTAGAGKILLEAAQAVVEESGRPELSKGIFSDVGKNGSHTVEVRVFLADAKIRESIMSTQQFVNKWREKIGTIPGAEFVRLQSDRGGPGSGSALTIELRHTEMSQLEAASSALAEGLLNYPRVKDIEDGFQPGKEQMDFRMKPEGLALGLTASDVGRQVRNFYEGAEVTRQQRGRDEIKVKVRLPKARRISENSLANITVRSPHGTDVPLMEVVEVERGRAYTGINRRNGQRAVTVQADVTPSAKAGEVINSVNENELPALMDQFPGLTYSFEGRQARNRESISAMKLMLPLVLFGIYALLAIPFRSYRQPIIVMISIPFGLVGAVIGHLIMGYSLSIIGLIGILALSGVVVNDALVLIDFANQGRKKGLDAHDSVVAAGIQRFRPIMLTTLTTFGGLAPMIFETSRQARFLIPMALSLGFGILFATIITLMLIPSLYMINEDIGALFKRLFTLAVGDETANGQSVPDPEEADLNHLPEESTKSLDD